MVVSALSIITNTSFFLDSILACSIQIESSQYASRWSGILCFFLKQSEAKYMLLLYKKIMI